MRNIYSAALLLFMILHFASCEKDRTSTIDFSKFTATDVNGAIMGEPDTTDWTSDAVWTSKESSFLNFNDSIPLSDSLTGWVQLSPAFPNPNNGAFAMEINTEKECKMKIGCVNTEMELLYYTARKFTGGPVMIAFDLGLISSFHENETYRMYYGFYNSKDSLYYKGHGDFRIE